MKNKRILWYPKHSTAILRNPERIFYGTNRMRAYNFHECIKDKDNVDSDIFSYTTNNMDFSVYDIVIFQKTFPKGKLNVKGCFPQIFVVMDHSDPVDTKDAREYHHYADLVVTSSHELTADTIAKGAKIPVETVLDNHDANPSWIKTHKDKERLRVTWYGFSFNYPLHVKPLKSILEKDFISFTWTGDESPEFNNDWGFFQRGVKMEMDWREAWRREDSWQHFIFSSDIGIVPVFDKRIKSPHKILNYMAYGIPVICSPTDAHRRIIRHGENGFFASNDEEWSKYLELLRDTDLRNSMGKKARESTLKEYSIQSISEKYYQTVIQHLQHKRFSLHLSSYKHKLRHILIGLKRKMF